MRSFLFIILISLSSTVFGEWTQVYRDDRVINYVDYSTKVKVGNNIKIWRKNIYLKPLVTNLGEIFSTNDFDEIDCNEKRYRTISYEAYSDVLQQKLVQKLTYNGDWNYFRPDSVGYQEVKVICSR